MANSTSQHYPNNLQVYNTSFEPQNNKNNPSLFSTLKFGRNHKAGYQRLDSNEGTNIANEPRQEPINYSYFRQLSVPAESSLNASGSHVGPSLVSNINRIGTTKKRGNVWLFVYIAIYVTFLIMGGVFFQKFELSTELEWKHLIYSTKQSFLAKYPQILDEDLEEFLEVVVQANDRGISPLRNSSSELNWAFGQALFFSSTVVTTIGYGHVTPLSQTGKIFCMIYATIGIPLTLVLLSAIVERLLIPANWLLGSLNARLGHLYQPFNIRLLHLFIIIFLVGMLFFAIPTAVFAFLEPSWGVLDAFYYCFISLTTIGLGDYIPGEGVSLENRSVYKVGITCYLILGLIAMMLTLTVFYDIPQLNLGQLFTENQSGETEKLRLSGNSAPCYSGPSGLYIPQRDEDMRRAVVRIRPHGEESPSPEEQPASVLHRDIRVP